jgi:hypothetical protein
VNRGAAPSADAASSPVKALPGLLLESLAALAEAGEVEPACRLAGRACSALRKSDPRAARSFDVLLHRLTPRLTW